MRNEGFTIVELMIVCIMIFILACLIFSIIHPKRVSRLYSSPISSQATQAEPLSEAPRNVPGSVMIDGHEYIHTGSCPNQSCKYGL